MSMKETLDFLRGFYANHFTEDGASFTPRMETVEGRLAVIDVETTKVLAEFKADGSLHYAEKDLFNALLDDEIDNGAQHFLSEAGHDGALDHEWAEWEGVGGTRPPLRKTCGPWVKFAGSEWVREDYRGEICVVVRKAKSSSGWEFRWLAEAISEADSPRGDIGYDGPERPPGGSGLTQSEDVAMHDADQWMLASGWIFVEDGSWEPRGVLFP